MSAPPTMIPDEIVEKAAKAIYDCEGDPSNDTWDMCRPGCCKYARAALESALPDLTAAARAEGMEEAVSLWDEWYRGKSSGGVHILKRAREIRSSLAPKATGEG